ncbi:amylo-alpha-1,6-glucosidase [Blastochloris viridis]|nr:amylo-alpha-1,6-glucosidase [Blastochloris viridis]ALK08485.1 Amylo-alpha-1,6-glucosidase [Blastochloris viridis]
MPAKSSAAPGLIDTVGESPFYIAATGPSARPRRTLKHGDCFAVLDSYGDIGASQGGPDGLFFADTRYLSRLELMINGTLPLLLGSTVRDDNLALAADLTNPDIYFDGRVLLPKDTIHIVRSVVLWDGVAHVRLGLRNHGEQPVRLGLAITFAADFADLFEVRGARRERHGQIRTEVVSATEVRIACAGLDGRTRTTAIRFDPAPETLAASAATWRVTLAADQPCSVFISIACDPPDRPPLGFGAALLAVDRARRALAHDIASIETSHQVLNEVLRRSMADLAMLTTTTPQGPFPYAGIPWYSTTFGRDGIITAIEMLWLAPAIARGVLFRLATLQAGVTDAAADAQPGKILHEMRGGEMAALGEVPFARYYGSVDSTPLFLILLGLYVERTNDTEALTALWPAATAALGWIDRCGDADGDGFVEYSRASANGLANQGWKDSHDAVFHADGRLAEGPIALVEVQAYVYLAKTLMARLARRLGHLAAGARLEEEAIQLADRVEQTFWSEAIGSYALALDGDKRRCEVRTSNAGHVLWAGLATPDRAARVAGGLMERDFFSGWGIRTVAEGEVRYNPMSYHNGSVWPHDNALIASGLARYGACEAVQRVFAAILDAAAYMDFRRLPELYCGFRRRTGRGPTLYPVACSPQAWASATPFSLVQSCLGLELKPETGEIRLNNPVLPLRLDWVRLRGLKVGSACADLLVRQLGGGVSVDLEHATGDARITVQVTR